MRVGVYVTMCQFGLFNEALSSQMHNYATRVCGVKGGEKAVQTSCQHYVKIRKG